METLSYGFKKPESGDRGPQVFPAIEDNFEQLNDHTHNGTNSARIASADLTKTTQTLLSGDWVLVSGGHYKQTVTLPGSYTYDAVTLMFKITSTGAQVFPTVEKVSANQYDVFFDDNSLGLTAYIN